MSEIYRVDTFDVPEPALDEFLARVRETQATLATFPGCRTNLVLSSPKGNLTRILTIVEWEDLTAFEMAKARMQQRYHAEGFDAATFTQTHGIEADLGVYQVVPT